MVISHRCFICNWIEVNLINLNNIKFQKLFSHRLCYRHELTLQIRHILQLLWYLLSQETDLDDLFGLKHFHIQLLKVLHDTN